MIGVGFAIYIFFEFFGVYFLCGSVTTVVDVEMGI